LLVIIINQTQFLECGQILWFFGKH
jgi:hypothetical protein